MLGLGGKPGQHFPRSRSVNLFRPFFAGVLQRPLTPILLQKYRDTNGRRIVIQIGGVYTTFCQKEGILLQKYRDRNGRCIAILLKSIGVRGRFDSPDLCWGERDLPRLPRTRFESRISKIRPTASGMSAGKSALP